jgi:hypothetical protein
VSRLRVLVLVLGIAAVVAALLLGLVPAKTTTKVHSTTVAGGKTTTVESTTTEKAPGGGRSDTSLVALLTLGVGAVLVGSFWNRIQELTIAGVSIKLSAAALPDPGIALVDAAAVQVVSSASADMLAAEARRVADRGLGLVRVDLREGDLWAPTNLGLFALLLASRTRAEVLVFTWHGDAGPDTYLGAASVSRLADKVARDDPDLADAHRATESMPLGAAVDGQSMGQRFVAELTTRDPGRIRPDEPIAPSRLESICGETLVRTSVAAEGAARLSKQKQREALAFPLPFVPITDRGALVEIVDRRHLAEMIAAAAVGVAAPAG